MNKENEHDITKEQLSKVLQEYLRMRQELDRQLMEHVMALLERNRKTGLA